MIPIPRCRLVIAPADGRVTTTLPERTPVTAGDVVATVVTASGAHELRAPRAGQVGGALTDVEQPVAAGQGVLWLDVARSADPRRSDEPAAPVVRAVEQPPQAPSDERPACVASAA